MASRMLNEIPKRAKNMILASRRLSGRSVLVLQDQDGVARPTYKDSQPLHVVLSILSSCFGFKTPIFPIIQEAIISLGETAGYSIWPKNVGNFSSNPPCKGYQYQLHLAETLVHNFPGSYSKWILHGGLLFAARPISQRQPALERKASGMHQGGQG